MTKQEMDEKAGKLFKLFLETLCARIHKEKYSSWKFTDNKYLSRFDNEDDIDRIYRHYRRDEIKGISLAWDSHPEVRDAFLQYLNVTYDDYLIISGKKKLRSIDDL